MTAWQHQAAQGKAQGWCCIVKLKAKVGGGSFVVFVVLGASVHGVVGRDQVQYNFVRNSSVSVRCKPWCVEQWCTALKPTVIVFNIWIDVNETISYLKYKVNTWMQMFHVLKFKGSNRK